MYATVEIEAELAGEARLVPREAVIDTGTRQITFVALGDGRSEPRTVTTGAAGADGVVEIVSGLSPGESVVTSGQFLLDAESRLQEAIAKMLAEKSSGGRPPAPHAHP
jgi:Cu(I)/Ag(I) efflux system membrane fusion protein/cobalt-zinc-cadmium efflux system membrane fusion protein